MRMSISSGALTILAFSLKTAYDAVITKLSTPMLAVSKSNEPMLTGNLLIVLETLLINCL